MADLIVISRVTVSIGAVGALAPMVFENVGTSTHGFGQLLSQFSNNFHKKGTKNIENIGLTPMFLATFFQISNKKESQAPFKTTNRGFDVICLYFELIS